MNITKGQSAQKQHLANGSMTYCNRKTSGIGNNGHEEFKWWANNYPDECCQRCLIKFNEKNKNRSWPKKDLTKSQSGSTCG